MKKIIIQFALVACLHLLTGEIRFSVATVRYIPLTLILIFIYLYIFVLETVALKRQQTGSEKSSDID